MRPRKNDQELIADAYNNIILDYRLDSSLSEIYNKQLVNEDILDRLRRGAESTYNAATNVIGDTVESVSDISKLPETLTNYFNEELPQYIDKLGDFMLAALATGASGALATYIIGKLLQIAAKKIAKESDIDTQAMLNMLPDEIRQKVKAIESLQTTDPAKYRQMAFQINRNAIKQLEKELAGTGKKLQRKVITSSLEFFGNMLSSGPGSLVGGLIIAILIHKLGFNTMPIFPNLL
jgi:hypothetical protein